MDDASVVDKDVDSSESTDHLLYPARDLGLVGDVGLNVETSDARRGDLLKQRGRFGLWADVEHRDVGPLGREAERDAASDPAQASCDQGSLASEPRCALGHVCPATMMSSRPVKALSKARAMTCLDAPAMSRSRSRIRA